MYGLKRHLIIQGIKIIPTQNNWIIENEINETRLYTCKYNICACTNIICSDQVKFFQPLSGNTCTFSTILITVCVHYLNDSHYTQGNIYGFERLFWLIHFLPVHPHFYPSTTGFTRPPPVHPYFYPSTTGFTRPPPVHPYFYPSTTGFTRPNDWWAGLFVKL